MKVKEIKTMGTETWIFTGDHKKGEVFKYRGEWYTALTDTQHYSAKERADLEDGWDVQVEANECIAQLATAEEVQAHLDGITQALIQDQEKTALFQIGQKIRRKGSTSGKEATVLAVDAEKCIIQFVFDGATRPFWEHTSGFEMI